jgi:L-amino acid N-acyltransferase YncA
MPAAIRLAAESDAAAMLAIYAPVVRETAISFELTPPDEIEFRSRIAAVMRLAPWLVLEDGHALCGYAYASVFRPRPAYRFTMETTVYVDAAHRGRGVGRALYSALLDGLRLQGFRRVVGGITLPNPASVALHESAGFRHVGVFAKCGFKFGSWHDVGFWDLELAPHVDVPPEPKSLGELAANPLWREALTRAAHRLRPV